MGVCPYAPSEPRWALTALLTGCTLTAEPAAGRPPDHVARPPSTASASRPLGRTDHRRPAHPTGHRAELPAVGRRHRRPRGRADTLPWPPSSSIRGWPATA